MNYQLLALDLDGTVLRNDYTLNPSVQKYVRKIVRKYHVIIVTGRHHTAAKPYYDQLGIVSPIICCNGAYQFDYISKQIMHGTAIPLKLADEFLKLATRYDLKIVMYTDSGMAFNKQDPMPYLSPLHSWANSYPKETRPNIYPVEDFVQELSKAKYIWKFVVQGETENFNKFLHENLIRTYFSGSVSGSNRIDLAIKGHSKGRAFRRYVSNLPVDLKRTVAVGDNFNDISMISSAGCGVALLNANEQVRSCADRLTSTDNEGEGLAKLLIELFPL